MSFFTIILGIIVIILLYLLYVFYIKKSTTLVKTASLNDSNPAMTTLASGQSTRYSYAIWIYVQQWNSNGIKTIFNRTDNIKLYLDTTTPTLKCDFGLDPSGTQTIKITDNFPIQKWVYVSLSCDNTIIDCYLDGKLVNSTQLSKSPKTPGTPSANPMNLGTGFNAYVSGFTSWGSPMGPQEVWNNYMSGNGSSAISRFFSSYNVDVAVSKDNVEQNKYRLF
jgi:hypothetical protein